MKKMNKKMIMKKNEKFINIIQSLFLNKYFYFYLYEYYLNKKVLK